MSWVWRWIEIATFFPISTSSCTFINRSSINVFPAVLPAISRASSMGTPVLSSVSRTWQNLEIAIFWARGPKIGRLRTNLCQLYNPFFVFRARQNTTMKNSTKKYYPSEVLQQFLSERLLDPSCPSVVSDPI